jgi:chemotaxis protein MotB
MADHPPEIVIIKRRSSHEEEHHGGAWKIAFADFMTAMMAFFLVLWIINATDKNTKTMIARYFNPVKMEQSSKTPKNIRSDGPAPAIDGPQYKDPKPTDPSAPETKKPTPDADAPQHKSDEKPEKRGASSVTDSDPANPRATVSEGVLFDDPYRSLDAIAGPSSPDLHVVAQAGKPKNPNDAGDPEAFRDPFRPVGREVPSDAPTAAEKPAPRPGSAATAPPEPAGAARRPAPQPTPVSVEVRPQPQAAPAAAPPAPAPAPSSTSAPAAATTADAGAQKARAATAAHLQKELELKIGGAAAQHAAGPAIDVKATSEGLLISLTDNLKFSMFAIGSAEPQRQVVQAMETIARSLKDRPGVIVVRGHTDGHPYKSAVYDNWRLSSARAQMAYYMLRRGGLPEARFERVEGYADRRLRDPAHPFAAENRRIEILLQEPKP